MKRELRLMQMGFLLIVVMAMISRVTALPPDFFRQVFISAACNQEPVSPNCATEIEECMELLQFNPGADTGPTPPDPSVLCADRPLFECTMKILNCTNVISAGVSKLGGIAGGPGGVGFPGGPGGLGFPPGGPVGLGFPGGPSGSGGSGSTEDPSEFVGSGPGSNDTTEDPNESVGSGPGSNDTTEDPSESVGSEPAAFTEDPSEFIGSGPSGNNSTENPSESVDSGPSSNGTTEDPSEFVGSGPGSNSTAEDPSEFVSSGPFGNSSLGELNGIGGPEISLPMKNILQDRCVTMDIPNCFERVQQCVDLIGGPGGLHAEDSQEDCRGNNCMKCEKMLKPTPKFLAAAQLCSVKVSGSVTMKQCMKPAMDAHVRTVFTSDIRPRLLKSYEQCYRDFDFEGIHMCMIKACAKIL